MYLVTVLRLTCAVDFTSDLRIAQNTIILQSTPTLIKVRAVSLLQNTGLFHFDEIHVFPPSCQGFKICYAEDPDGFYCPELMSLWSSIVHEMGAPACQPYMQGLYELALPVAKSGSIGSIVAILLVANLVCSFFKKKIYSEPVDSLFSTEGLPLYLLFSTVWPLAASD